MRDEEIVFVILFEDVEFGGIGERAEVNGGGVYGGGDVFEFKAEVAGGEREIADVADESDVGIVDGDVEIGLVGERGGGGAFCIGGIVLAAGVGGSVRGDDGGWRWLTLLWRLRWSDCGIFLAVGLGVSIFCPRFEVAFVR